MHEGLFVRGKGSLAWEAGVRWEKAELLVDQGEEVVEGQKVTEVAVW